jgi:thiamine kinase-like enzyme
MLRHLHGIGVRRPGGSHGQEPAESLPDAMVLETLNEVCLEHLGEPIKHVSHVHLSGWKSTGSFRLLLQTESGSHRSLVFRNAIYDSDHIPALARLPIMPGPAEYLVYSNAGGALAKYLPDVLWCSEVVPGKHYQYLLEDLSDTHRRAKTREDILRAAAELHHIHCALEEWSLTVDHSSLPRYEHEFSAALQEYARANLETYVRHTPSRTAAEVLELWPLIAEVHKSREFRDLKAICLIHGDLNRSNIMIAKEHPHRIRLIDWEWAGQGIAHADLASLLKKATPAVHEYALAIFFEHCDGLSPDEHRRLYEWCQLERGLTDAAFLAVQYMKRPPVGKHNLPKLVERSLQRLLRAYRELV